MGQRRDSLPTRLPQLFHECRNCHEIGLRPGILATKHGDYGMRNAYKDEKELHLNKSGLCDSCAKVMGGEA
jgi:hypothetical protein